jgi:hypothetical protein
MGRCLPAPAAPFEFDQLAREVAEGLSRREAMRRLGFGLAGMLLASFGRQPVWGQGNSDCAQFCDAVFPPGSDRGLCKSDAAQGAGICFQCGPGAPAGHADFCNVPGVGPTCCPPTAPSCCNGRCVSLGTNVNNCGQCGLACPSGQACCNGACINTQTDVNHCGGCGQSCPAGQSCVGGTCGCPAGQTLCGSACVDTRTSPSHCGGCGIACPSGLSCINGRCGRACTITSDCPAGETCCSGRCVNLQNNPGQDFCDNCSNENGKPITVCGVVPCCNATCVPANDPNNCGGCGVTCPGNTVCCNQRCCAAGESCCGQTCCGASQSCCHGECVNGPCA